MSRKSGSGGSVNIQPVGGSSDLRPVRSPWAEAQAVLPFWQTLLFEQGAKAFEIPRDSRERQPECKLIRLENIARERAEVIAEVGADMVRLKRESGGVLPAVELPP